MARYGTVIFDLDGTLLNTLEDLCDSTNFALACFGFPARTLAEVRSFVGNGIGKLIERAVPEGTESSVCAQVLEVFKAHYSENCNNKTRAYDGIEWLLKKLKEEKIKIAVVSNKVDSAVKVLCERYFADYISVAIGETENIRRKPAPDTVFAAMELLGAEKKNTVYVGDSEVDVETAKNAGIGLVAVSWGFRNRDV
ncbi:MAG: HAD-IA family hydrolase, partial [Clostridia bacterium]|nr:HAD-IA family hydrolase [Clostridia bacterium]